MIRNRLKCRLLTEQQQFELSDPRCDDLQKILNDAERFVRENFECINEEPSEVYWSALTWLPQNSWVRQQYTTPIPSLPCMIMGRRRMWGAVEQILHVKSGVGSVAFSPDGTRVVSGSYDKTVRIWTASTGEEEHRLEGHSDPVRSVAFSPDGTRVVSGSWDKTVRIWNASTGEEEHRLEGHSFSVMSVAFSPDGTRVVSGSRDETVRIWNASTGEEEHRLEGHYFSVMSVAFSPDGTRVVSGSDDETVRIWNASTGEEEHRLE